MDGEFLQLHDKKDDGEDGLVLSWCNVCVSVKRKIEKQNFWDFQKYENKQILNNVNGYVRSGTLMAIMGASGAGKTTLLATVSQRVKYQSTGEVTVNGRQVDNKLMNNISGFVPQHDLVVPTLTLAEHIKFMAKLKMDRRVRDTHRIRRINSLLTELGLAKCRKTKLSELSGGELKRLSLAVQLLTDPPLLFCDEPTTGLDSFSAGNVVELLRQFAERGKTVVCTIHQPASGIFDLFHTVLLLAGGRVAFLGQVSDASSYFNSVGLVCPSTYNPAEFYVQQLAVMPGKEFDCKKKIQWLCDQFDVSTSGISLTEAVRKECYSQRNIFSTDKGNWSSQSSTSDSDGSLLITDNEIKDVDKLFSKYMGV